MKKDQILPHLIALGIFILVALIYSAPVFQGKKLEQHDIIQSLGMQGEMTKYREEKGEHILWTNSMFSGMPTFQIRPYNPTNIFGRTFNLLNRIIPSPAYHIFLLMVGFYVLCILMGINYWISIAAAIAFSLSTFNIISLEAGHTSKVRTMSLMAPLIAAVWYAFKKNLVVGSLIAAIIGAIQLHSNHLQITYYTVLAIGIFIIYQLIIHIKEKQVPKYFKTLLMLGVAGLFSIGCNASLLTGTYQYAKHTIRGGSSELTEKKAKTNKGLDKDYAMSWSEGKMETFTLLIPNFYGGGSGEKLGEKSNTFEALRKRGVGKQQASNIIQQVPTYWGTQPFTSGPIYFGAGVIFLFVLGLIIVKQPIKWWIAATALFSLMLAWGKNFSILSDLFFNYFPLYNKFRTPSMTLSLTQLLFPLLGALAVNEIIKMKLPKEEIKKALKIATGITAGICVFFMLLGGSMLDFSAGQRDQSYRQNYAQATKDQQFANAMVSALEKDRAKMMRMDAGRSVVFILIAAGLLWAFVAGKLQMKYMVAGLGLSLMIDLWMVDKRYLNNDKFVDKSQYKKSFAPRKVDRQILQDPDLYYRVFDLTGSPFNDARPSNFHKSVGGYHAAKLQRYQDLIERHLSRNNMKVFNMLNTKYFIVNNNGTPTVQRNPGALGNAWFVEKIKWVKNADEEINALNDFNPEKEAVIDERFKPLVDEAKLSYDPDAKIKLTSYHPEKLVYEVNTPVKQFAVFSEIYYDGNKDWISYIDDKPVPHVRVNYVLRGMAVPAGKHTIKFSFEPKLYAAAQKVSLAFSVVLLLACIGVVVMNYRNKQPLTKL